ncbi:MAG: ADP-ribose pyrophosphatase [Gammaproteobacteria bacterium]|jgi:ADP-ribose pyrophosphatase
MVSHDVDLVDKTVTYEGFFRVIRYLFRHRLFGGGLSEVLSREVLDRGAVVGVLPVDVKRDQVVLVEQFRSGAFAAGWDPWLLECVAGMVEAGEAPEDVARRESLEESGCTLGRLRLVARYLSSPGGTNETMTLFCGEVDASTAAGVHGLASEGEDIRVHVYTVAQAIELLEQGKVSNAKTVVALQWLALHYDALKAEWTVGN